MELTEEEKKFEQKCQNVQDKVIRQNILFIFTKTETKKYSEYNINLSIPNQIQKERKEDFEFILIINITRKNIFLFSKNINPISDGRNILPLLNIKINNTKSKIKYSFISIDDIDLFQIITELNKFTSENNFVNLNGYFYLGEEYDKKIIENLNNIEKIYCNHLDIINGSTVEIASLCTISDDYFCLYEKDVNNQNNYILVFYSNIKNLLSFNKTLDSTVTLNWKKKVTKKSDNNENIYCLFSLKINSTNDDDMDKVMDILIEKIRKIGFKMDINEKKKGEIPNIDIEAVEGEIIRLESQLKNRENILVFNKLIQNYEKVIEYYSALNDEKYIGYNGKMKYLLSNEKYAKYIK